MMKISIRTKIKIIIILSIFSCITIIRIKFLSDCEESVMFLRTSLDLDVCFNVSCYTEPGEELPYVDEKFHPKKHSIFFHETSCRGGLNSRQACSVEAAARYHPLWDIHVFFVSPVRDMKHNSLVTLKKFENVKFSRVNVEEYSKGTPLENLVSSGGWMRTMYRISHTSDLLRYLTLYKWGGIYLDLDTVVVKSLEDLAPNWTARESDTAVAAGVMAFSNDKVGRMMAENSVKDLVKNWRGDVWNSNGPGVINRVLSRLCGTKNVTKMNANTCQGFEVYNQKLFYPIRWLSASVYFDPPTTTYPEAYVYHVWNRITKDINVAKGCLYDLIAKENCPDVYMAFGSDFGM